MSLLMYAAMVFVLHTVPIVTTSVVTTTPKGVPGYTVCSPGRVEIYVLQAYDGAGIRSRILEQVEVERQMLRAADCVDDGSENGSLAPLPHDSPFLAERADAWVAWALANRAAAVTRLEVAR